MILAIEVSAYLSAAIPHPKRPRECVPLIFASADADRTRGIGKRCWDWSAYRQPRPKPYLLIAKDANEWLFSNECACCGAEPDKKTDSGKH